MAQPPSTAATVDPALIDAAVAAAMTEIADDVESEIVPIDVADFSSLHSHVDANEYAAAEVAPLWDADVLLPPEVGFVNIAAYQSRVEAWLASGGLRLEVSQRAWNRLTPAERTALEAEGLAAIPVPTHQ